MRAILLVALGCIVSFTAVSQDSSSLGVLTNSYTAIFQLTNPTLNYTYRDAEQIHDYSGNWDLDGDGILDSVMFVGNGGVHLYFHLLLQLSSENVQQSFPMLSLDMPVHQPVDSLWKNYGTVEGFPQLIVHDFNGDGNSDIYLYVAGIEKHPDVRGLGITSRHIVLSYAAGDVVIKNYQP